MSNPDYTPNVSSESVRTPSDVLLVVSLCLICQRVELRGRQTVCSAACRRERTRLRHAERCAARDREIRELLEAALKRLGDKP